MKHLAGIGKYGWESGFALFENAIRDAKQGMQSLRLTLLVRCREGWAMIKIAVLPGTIG
jgi:hypothetical protein